MSKKPKFRSFSKRLTRWIAFTQLIVMVFVSYWIFVLAKNIVLMEEASLHKSSLLSAKANVGQVLSEVFTATSNRVDEIQENLGQPDKLADIMSKVVAQNPTIRSCGVSFVDSYYLQKGRWFCPYAVRDDDGNIEKRIIGSASHDYLKEEWFTEALKADSCYWSKPFFDASDSITPLVACMMPIRDKQGKTVAILGADLSLSWISQKTLGFIYSGNDSVKIQLGNSSDGRHKDDSDFSLLNIDWRGVTKKFIIDQDGTYIAHPDKNFIIKENYFDLAKTTKDSIDDHVGRQMVAGKRGAYNEKNTDIISSLKFFDSHFWSVYIFYEPIEHTTWSIASVVPTIMVDPIANGLGVIMLVLIALALLVTRIAGRMIIKRATKPLSQLAVSASEVAKGNFSAPLPVIKHNDEIRQLRDSFDSMQHSLTHYVDELKSTTASKAAIENELKIAHDIQMSMLPKTFPPYPERDDIDIYGFLKPAKDVGGDLFDFYIHNEKLFFCIGDVSGKGVPASLVMAVTRSLFRNISAHTSEPEQIAYTLNEALTEGNETAMFVTAFIGVLDLATGHMSFCNAGHNNPLIIGREVSMLDCNPNLPLGVMDGVTFEKQEMVVEPQTTIFLYTDGLNEAENIRHDQFDIERVIDLATSLVKEGQNQPTTMIQKMTEAVHVFVGDAEQSDDLTMLAIKYIKR
ncbi:MAG: SpoIIE family protein phosphatase [Prevotella sp.]|nr:SpoIIE family protein phosphatase [Prevotella sp.]